MGSARSQKSVAWSTAASDEPLVPDEDEKERNIAMVTATAKLVYFAEIFSGMWASREMLKDDKDKQLYVKTTLRELFIYIIFLCVVVFRELN